MDVKNPIGVLDSGVGGLSVLKELQKLMPHEDFIYVGDTARTPYGPRTEKEVRKFVEEIVSYLETQGVKQVIIACNTLTVLGVDSIKGNHPFHVIGMSKGEHLVLKATKNKKIGIMATEFTIGTEAHKKAILAVDNTAEVHPLACPKYVPLIEGEHFDTKAMQEAIAEYVKHHENMGIDTLILSCTHYPFIKDSIQENFKKEITIIDPAAQTALDAQADLREQGLLRDSGLGKTRVCFTADLERGKRLAKRMVNMKNSQFEEITL